MAVRIEDAGFDIRDMIAWVYGSGFPKSLDVSKAIDKAAGNGVKGEGSFFTLSGGKSNGGSKFRSDHPEYEPYKPATDAARQWQGWGTALKPALEPITVARKPLVGTVAANVLAHGTGALNIDGCRVGYCGTEDAAAAAAAAEIRGRQTARNTDGWGMGAQTLDRETYLQGPAGKGRWPANLIHDGSDEVLHAFPLAAGQLVDASTTAPSEKTAGIYGAMRRERGNEPSTNSENDGARRCDAGSAARFFYCAKASRRDRNDGVEHLTSGTHSPGTFQAEGTDRSSPNNHPTVKPTDLMRYLCRLITPPGGVVLDPFMGSGSTGKAAMLEGFGFIGIEREEPYFRIAKSRIEAAMPIPEWLK
jgi:site-specific DNA-methyltransferase (adenine-specific)